MPHFARRELRLLLGPGEVLERGSQEVRQEDDYAAENDEDD